MDLQTQGIRETQVSLLRLPTTKTNSNSSKKEFTGTIWSWKDLKEFRIIPLTEESGALVAELRRAFLKTCSVL